MKSEKRERGDEKVFDKKTLLINLAGFIFFVLYFLFYPALSHGGLIYTIIPTSIFMSIMAFFHLSSLQTLGKKLLRTMEDLFLIVPLIFLDFVEADYLPRLLVDDIMLSLENLVYVYIIPVVVVAILSFVVLKIKIRRSKF